MWELGTALVLEVPNHRLGRRDVVREAIWLNPIYRMDGRPIYTSGALRYAYERRTNNHAFDLGGRFGVRYNFVHYSIEAIERWRSKKLTLDDDRSSTRVVGAIGYGLNQSTQVNLTFGKNYGLDFTNSGSLVASFGLTVGLGSVPLGPTP
jgi:hypothetical protein